jgi:hypothetical protein
MATLVKHQPSLSLLNVQAPLGGQLLATISPFVAYSPAGEPAIVPSRSPSSPGAAYTKNLLAFLELPGVLVMLYV